MESAEEPLVLSLIHYLCIFSSVSDPDLDWIRIQIGAWIRIRNPDPDPDPAREF